MALELSYMDIIRLLYKKMHLGYCGFEVATKYLSLSLSVSVCLSLSSGFLIA
jgi:hypothetical protein